MVKCRCHTNNLQCFCIKQYTKVAEMAVSIQDNSVQYAHPSESVPTANTIKKGQQFWNSDFLLIEDCTGFHQPHSLVGKEWTFSDQISVIIAYIVWHSSRT